MVWGKVDDKLHSHRKRRRAGLEAMGLWVVGLSYCGDLLTDGFIDDEYVGGEKRGRVLAQRLVEAGLWHSWTDQECPQGSEHCTRPQVDGPGWWFHDWNVSNPTKAKVTEKRSKEAAKLAAWRAAKAAKASESNGSSNPVTNRPVTRLHDHV
jgi:hypothetical protein